MKWSPSFLSVSFSLPKLLLILQWLQNLLEIVFHFLVEPAVCSSFPASRSSLANCTNFSRLSKRSSTVSSRFCRIIVLSTSFLYISMTAWMLSPETFVGLYLLITLIMIYDYNSGLLIPDNNLADRFIHSWYIIMKGLPKIKLRLTEQRQHTIDLCLML